MKLFVTRSLFLLVAAFSMNCASGIYTFSKNGHIYQENTNNRIYVGTRLDSHVLHESIRSEGHEEAGFYAATFSFVDLPLSFGLDTVFLPYTVIYYLASPKSHRPEKPSTSSVQ